jgi:hypothetical protein
LSKPWVIAAMLPVIVSDAGAADNAPRFEVATLKQAFPTVWFPTIGFRDPTGFDGPAETGFAP